jgi:hypothetical protein
MKKKLLTCLALAPALFYAQTTIITDNFDSYTAGNGVVTESAGIWDTWSGGGGTAEEALVSSAYSSSTSNSMHVKNGGPSVYENDMILAFPATYTTGVYEFNCAIYVTQGDGGYINLGGAWTTGGGTYQYGGDFYFNADGSGFVDAPATLPFTYNVAAWNTVKIRVDLVNTTKELFINDVSFGQNAWGAASGFGAADIFGVGYATNAGTTQVTSNFYIDDVTLVDMSGVGLNENVLDATINVYPSINSGQFSIELKDAASEKYDIVLTDISGNIVHSRNVNVSGSATLNFDLNIASGIYFINFSNGTNTSTQRIIVK